MYKKIIISIIFILSNFFTNSYLVVETHYIKSMLDRNNVVNKGLWVRNRVENKNPGDFIFRANSLDVDSVLQNNFDAFGDNNVQNSPFLTSYVERNKRSPIYKSKRDSKENVNKCKNKSQCISTDKKEDSIIKSKFISTLKPSSFLMEYPHAVAALINDEGKHESETKDKKQVIKDAKKIEKVKSPISTNLSEINQENIIDTDNDSTKTIIEIPTTTSFIKRDVNNTLVIPRRNHNYKYELIKDFEFKEINNTGKDKKDVFRSVFDKEDIAWQNSAPISNANVYKVIPKSQENVKNKPITERGIIKVLSILTKTFKKIMKQHNDIKRIHKRLNNLNDDFVKNVEILTNKFEDFNSKYSEILRVDQELKQVLAILKDKEQYFLAKEKDMTKNLLEFENQQKKFLLQQKQFYNVQKLILTQNEKINLKQDIIAKTQSEISQRQNNFARILKKAKQIYIDTKNSPIKLNTGITKSKTELVKQKLESVKDATTVPTTESVKINLFAIPTTSSIKNQDQMLIKEKDDHSIDDLILKYYFNNTFLDEIMKSKILSAFLNEENPKNSKKSKRNQSKLNSTILLPVNKLKKDINTENKTRQRRWIKHSKKNVHKNVKITTSKPKTNIKENVVDTGNTVPININKILLKNAKAGPFMTMAISFCKEIGQDISVQSLNWCVEKTLRRLQVKEFKMESVMRPSKPGQMTEKQNISQNDTSTTETSSTIKMENPLNSVTTEPTQDMFFPETSSTIKMEYPLNSVTTEPTQDMFFPDNDELESKLKEYELQPDPEGTIYYDGSLHSSDLGRIVKADSEGFSDIMPGLDSDSRVQVDPLALDLQAQRRANVRRINERIIKMKMA